MAAKESSNPEVWRALPACYNAGNLVGQWFDATDPDAIEAWQEEHQASTGHEEFAIHDYSDCPDLGEYPDLQELAEWAKLAEREGAEVVRAYVEIRGHHYANAENFKEDFCGVWDSKLDYAYDYIENCGLLRGADDLLAQYFDYEAFARDLFMDGYSAAHVRGGVAVFRD